MFIQQSKEGDEDGDNLGYNGNGQETKAMRKENQYHEVKSMNS